MSVTHPESRDRTAGPSNPVLAIFWISVLGLFLELLLIRWVGTEIRIFAYVQNTVLVVCFLGLGAGLFTARRKISFGLAVWPLVVLTALLALPITPGAVRDISDHLSVLGDLNIWYAQVASSPLEVVARVSLGLVLTFAVMLLVLGPFVPIGRVLGRLLDDHPRPILAYSVNVFGSLVGILLFVLLSRLHQPPALWFAAVALLLLPFFVGRRPAFLTELLPLVMIPLLAWVAEGWDGSIRTVWSPYQKLALFGPPVDVATKKHTIEVNNVGYQQMLDLREETLEEVFGEGTGRRYVSQYDVPFLLHPGARTALMVGTGAGNDVAGALRHGVERVTAVEIDPAIIEFGRELHPERPYDSERVRIVNDDARSWFSRSPERYDVIVFGLLDSHTTTAMTNARLDHYVYTRESIRQARSLLEPGGTMVLSFEARKQFIADRMAGAIREEFGQDPMVFRVPYSALGWGGVMFVAGDLDALRGNIAANEGLAGLIDLWQERFPIELEYATPPATDDWPYLYLKGRGIPPLHILLSAVLLALFVGVTRRLRIPGLNPRAWDRSNWHFFFLGAAFLLLEVQNISKASVALGNTWSVNAVIISGVLAMVLLANLVAAIWPRLPLPAVYAALLATVLGLYFVDLARFAALPYSVKAPLVGALTTLPMLFSGIVFVRSFAAASRKDIALGANLMGALAGAVLEATSFLVGIKALLLMVAVFYALAFATAGRVAAPAREEGTAVPEGVPAPAPV